MNQAIQIQQYGGPEVMKLVDLPVGEPGPGEIRIRHHAVGPSLVAYRLWGLGVAAAGPAVAAFFGNLTPLFAALLSAALLGEWPRPFHGLAFALIGAGILVSSRQARAQPRPADAPG